MQDLVDSSTECVQLTRNRMSCEGLCSPTRDSGGSAASFSDTSTDADGHISVSSNKKSIDDDENKNELNSPDKSKSRKFWSLLSRFVPTDFVNWVNSIQVSTKPSGVARFGCIFLIMIVTTVALMIMFAALGL